MTGATVTCHRPSELTAAEWDRLNPGDVLQHGHEFLAFRERAEPGEHVCLAARHGGELAAGLPLFASTDTTALFSDPWRLLTSRQFVRAELADLPERELHARHDELLTRLAGGIDAAAIRAALGPAAVCRYFDDSDVLVAPGLSADRQDDAVAGLLDGAQSLVRAGRYGALAFPFVAAGNDRLRRHLIRSGFRGGMLTARASVELPADGTDLAGWVATLSRSTRRRYRQETARFADSGLRIAVLPLDDATLRRVAELEAQTLARYGRAADVESILALRRELAGRFGSRLRLTGALAGDRLVACGVDLVGGADAHGMSYGCDYGSPFAESVYAQVAYWAPLAHCLAAGVRRVRHGFEAFEPKVLRGARLTGLECWIWTPDPAVTEAAAELLGFLDDRARRYLARWPGILPAPAG